MPNNLTDAAELIVLNAITGVSGGLFTAPLKLRLMTANGTDSANGTEVPAAGGTYTSQTIAFGTAAAGAASNTAQIQFTNMPACTVVGFEIWDSNGTPRRVWWFPATSSRVVNAGDTYNVAVGAISVSID